MLWDAVKNGERLGGGPQYRASATDSTAPFGCSPVTNGDQRCGLVTARGVGKVAGQCCHTCKARLSSTCGRVEDSGQTARMPINPGPKLWTVKTVAGRTMFRP